MKNKNKNKNKTKTKKTNKQTNFTVMNFQKK